MTPLLALVLVLGGCNGKSDTGDDAHRKQPESDPIEGDSGGPEGSETEEDVFCEGPTVGTGELVDSEACSDGVCPVAAGEFVMGSVMDRVDECPSHRVSLDAFAIDQFEVTWDQHDACVEAGQCEAPPAHCRTTAEGWVDGGSVANLPVVCVDYSAAQAYCTFAGGRLPTEAEWEKAARGVEGTRWPWGSEAPTCDLTNYRFVVWYCHEGAVDVGSYDAVTAYGAKDMAGNVWEWTADHYDAEAYRSSDRDNPTGPTTDCHESVGGAVVPCFDRVIRGGAYNVTATNIRASARSRMEPDQYDTNLGIRCAY